jgi:PAS domain S-box-containing protein
MATTPKVALTPGPLTRRRKPSSRDKNKATEIARPERGSWILHADKEDLISILDKLPVGVAVLGSPNGNALYINNQIVDTLGYTLSETPSSRSLMKKAIPDRKARSRASKEWMQTVGSGGGPITHPFVCGDGTVRIFENRSIVHRKDLIVNLWIDVTRSEMAEAQLRESESRFRSFFENSSDPFMLFEADRVVGYNRAAQKLFGHEDREQMIGTTIGRLSPREQPDGARSSARARQLLAAAMKVGRNRFEWVALRNDGKEVPTEVSATPVILQGKTLLFAVLRDITKWKEAQSALLHAKTDLETKVMERTADLASVNKDLHKEIKARMKVEQQLRKSREELRNLSEHLQLIRERDRADIAREVHDELGQALSAVVIDLACLKRQLPPGQNGRREVSEIEEKIGATMRSVRDICRKLRPAILDDLGLPTAIAWHLRDFQERTRMQCTAAIDQNLPDDHKELGLVLFRVYQEAMTNIVRHARATRVEIVLKYHKKNLLLKVKDNGIGISAKQSVSPLSLGILGIRERVRFWGGKSSFGGSPGKGTTVTISMPLRERKLKPKRSARGLNGDGRNL